MEFIQTVDFSLVDGLNTLEVKSFPYSPVLVYPMLVSNTNPRQAEVLGTESKFAVVFAAMGITFEEADYFISDFRRTGAIDRSKIFINLGTMAIERISTPRMALFAEFLALKRYTSWLS